MEEVKIGDQIWLARNLDVSTFRNGDLIPYAETDDEWVEAIINGEPACCYYENDPYFGKELEFSKLYNWHAVNDPRGLAPEGWKIPSDKDYDRLADYLGSDSVAGKKMKSASDFWVADGNGTNESGFLALKGGVRYHNGAFVDVYESGYWWCSAKTSGFRFGVMCLEFQHDKMRWVISEKNHLGCSVRCLKD